ncbi:MAG: DciA family protein [Actinomycetota bacterium]
MNRAQPRPGRDARRRAQTRQANLRRGGYSGAHPDERDPRPAGEIMAALFAERGWQQPLAQARVFADWAGLVGAELAGRCSPVSLADGELRVAAESTAWATQLRMLTGTLLARLAAELGPTVVTRMHVTGPVAPSWRFGPRAVRGARGPRDTYG